MPCIHIFTMELKIFHSVLSDATWVLSLILQDVQERQTHNNEFQTIRKPQSIFSKNKFVYTQAIDSQTPRASLEAKSCFRVTQVVFIRPD